LGALLAVQACASDELQLDVPMTSRGGTTRSHFPDTNCMACHQATPRIEEGRNTPGFFTVAGTVRETDGTVHGNTTVIVYDALYDTETKTPGNELLRIDVDALGMFYTTEPLPPVEHMHPIGEEPEGHDHGEKYFPAVLDNETGVIKHMYYGIDTGACGVCHQDLYRDTSPRDDIEGDPWRQLPATELGALPSSG
jgi:hypothetical protein